MVRASEEDITASDAAEAAAFAHAVAEFRAARAAGVAEATVRVVDAGGGFRRRAPDLQQPTVETAAAAAADAMAASGQSDCAAETAGVGAPAPRSSAAATGTLLGVASAVVDADEKDDAGESSQPVPMPQ